MFKVFGITFFISVFHINIKIIPICLLFYFLLFFVAFLSFFTLVLFIVLDYVYLHCKSMRLCFNDIYAIYLCLLYFLRKYVFFFKEFYFLVLKEVAWCESVTATQDTPASRNKIFRESLRNSVKV